MTNQLSPEACKRNYVGLGARTVAQIWYPQVRSLTEDEVWAQAILM